MSENHVCPVWIGYLLASPIRRLFQNPEKILSPYVNSGDLVIDVGSAMGYFSLPMAEMVAPAGKVVCVDVQKKMLDVLRRKAERKGVAANVETRLCSEDSLNLESYRDRISLALLFAVVHEVPDQGTLFSQVFDSLKPGGKCLFSEPSGHVSHTEFNHSVNIAVDAGYVVEEAPIIRKGHSAILGKPQ